MKPRDNAEQNTQLLSSQATLDLVEKLSPHVTYVKVPARRRLYYSAKGVDMCYLIRSGLVHIRRDIDEIVLSLLPTPNIAGITNLLSKTGAGLFLETLSECEIATITTEHAHKLVDELNLWELMAKHVTKVASNIYLLQVRLTAPTAYEIVRFQLFGLMREPESLRDKTSAAKYIMDRTHLSRSSVMKILAQLKQGDYVQIEDGILKALNNLPARY
ncbi:winged helix-turn-helix transcriptional regulator [Buttiauxella ferragutiae]|uniref:winged helix-turn-helix transcriptional regulator n=1 Tax=Buttiauxella ferragutiae TaxID=82989 RepID=UPI003524292F